MQDKEFLEKLKNAIQTETPLSMDTDFDLLDEWKEEKLKSNVGNEESVHFGVNPKEDGELEDYNIFSSNININDEFNRNNIPFSKLNIEDDNDEDDEDEEEEMRP